MFKKFYKKYLFVKAKIELIIASVWELKRLRIEYRMWDLIEKYGSVFAVSSNDKYVKAIEDRQNAIRMRDKYMEKTGETMTKMDQLD